MNNLRAIRFADDGVRPPPPKNLRVTEGRRAVV